ARPNDFGVQILNGAHGNVVGGTTVAQGNQIAFNNGPGVAVEGDGSVDNRINANRIFANNDSSSVIPSAMLQFDGSSYARLPYDLIREFSLNETVEAWFRTTSGGVIVGYQSGDPATTRNSPWYSPVLYVGFDGKLYGELQRYN